MDELRRREAAARGEDPDPARPGGPGRRPPPSGRPPGPPDDAGGFGASVRRAGRGAMTVLAVVVVLFLILLFSVGIDLWTDALWFASVGYDDVFWTRLGAQAWLFVGTFALALAVMLGSVWIASRFSPQAGDGTSSLQRLFERLNEAAQAAERGQNPWRGGPRWERPGGGPRDVSPGPDAPDVTPIARLVIAGIAVFIALGLAGSVAAGWETVLLWQHRVPFSTASTVADPVFGRDISFFLFDLPFLRLVQAVFNGIVVGALLVTLARYGVAALVGRLALTTPVRLHLGILGALVLASVAVGYQIDKLELAYSARGVATGVSYTDANAQFLAYDVLSVVSGLAAVLLLGGAFTKLLWPLGLTLAVWFVASIVVGRLYPAAVQQLTVVPNAYAQEAPYIANNIAMTRLAYGLDRWEDRAFRGEDPLTPDAIAAEDVTFRNARLWDYRPLGDTLDQLQRVRRYYDFHDVDTDRYMVEGIQRQVMLSARELALDQDPNVTGFVNHRIVYTHGIGVAMVPVNEVANEGQPRLVIRDLPPVSIGGAPEVTEPRIYFGERPSDYVLTGARQAEFDYPTGEGEAGGDPGTETRWIGETGIRLDNPLMRLLFSLRLRDFSLLISDQITDDTQLLFHRSIGDRLPRIAPFLRFDKDPYVVVSDGRLVFLQDAYTVSNRFPHAQYFDPAQLDGTGLGAGPFNYLRNSVKISMDAYDGTMRFYVADDADPLIRAYAGVFPSLFRPLDELPESLRPHLRVPEELFNVQTRIFGRYHVTNTLRFFQSDDVWTVPQGQGSTQSLPSEAYYVVMRMPGEPEPEFLLLQPMVPNQRPNMIAWVAARNDAPNYGTARVYRFPAETTVFGPAQIEARITQDPAISQQITLWSQSGSDVIRGNLIVVPIRDSLLYLQPIYLQSQASAFPEFRRIVVASPREVVWGETLGEALELLLQVDRGGGPSPSPGPSPTPSPGASPTPGPTESPGASPSLPADVADLIAYANEHFELAQEALRDGDFARYGEEMALVEAALQELAELTGAPPTAP